MDEKVVALEKKIDKMGNDIEEIKQKIDVENFEQDSYNNKKFEKFENQLKKTEYELKKINEQLKDMGNGGFNPKSMKDLQKKTDNQSDQISQLIALIEKMETIGKAKFELKWATILKIVTLIGSIVGGILGIKLL
ncbi:MAG: hypothetical protein PWQ77_2043 [Kosmotogales bacterium]|nr:hypothetical protein [Kosmotogales bacterium]